MLRSIQKRLFASYDFDLAVIGGGPGGYVAAIKGSQLGLKTVCIEKRGSLGGTCLNVGCIPAKALLNSSHKYMEAKSHFKDHGIFFDSLNINFAQMMKTKEDSVSGLTRGIEGLFKKNGVSYIKGAGSFKDPHTISINNTETITSKNIVIATGSEPTPLPGNILEIDENRILSNTGAMALKEIPKKLVVIGAGVIGLELGSVYSRLGTEVIVVEYLNRLAPSLDIEVSTALQKILTKQGLKFLLNTKVTGGSKDSNSVTINLESVNSNPDTPKSISSDYLLVAIGRRAYTQGVKLENIGIGTDKYGKIEVNDHLQIKGHDHIYAVGDCIKGLMLAHKAEEEGIFAVEHMSGNGGHINYDAIPSVIYTMPEVAQVGKTEEQLKEFNIPYTKGVFPFIANSRAKANQETDGFVKVLAHKDTNTILGVHIIGPMAGEIIMEPVLGMEYQATGEEIARTCHAHPGFGEAIKEACLATYGKTINY
jgi:dihydrolipoamide dehydrogenase